MYGLYRLEIIFFLFGCLTATCFADCNVTLQASTTPHNFTSPNYPRNYDNFENCYWDILPNTAGYNIILDMIYFDIESTGFNNYCRTDKLIIYNTTAHRPIRTICGQDRWLMNLAGGKDPIRVIFQTDSSVTESGFLIRYYETPELSACGGTLVASSSSQLITSPGFPNTYYHREYCTWNITTENENEVILLETVSSDIEMDARTGHCYHDYVRVTDGVSGQSLGTYCGVDEPVFLSGGNLLLVNFFTDTSTTKKGFQLKYTSISASGSNVQFQASSHQLGIISPGYQSRYPNNVNSTWTIVPDNSLGMGTLHVNLHNIDVRGGPGNCTQDKILIDSRYRNGTEHLTTVCNNQTVRWNYSTDGQVTLKFITDSSVVGSGFRLTYQAESCGETSLVAQQSWQYIVSPNYPHLYNSNAKCSWTIRAPYHNYRVRLNTVTSSLERTASCSADYLAAYDGNSAPSPLLGKWCGSTRPSYVSSGQYLTIVFHTNSYNNYRGFNIRYKTQSGPAPQCDSGTKPAQTYPSYLTSPGYSDNYHNGMACTWTIRAPSGRVKVYIFYMDIERSFGCEYDYLKFTDGVGTFSRLIGQLCGSQTGTYYSTGNYMTIKFKTDRSIVGGGFRLQYSVDHTSPTTPAITTCGASHLTASTLSYNYLHSPGYPNDYLNNMDCHWTISTSVGQKIQVDILNLHMEQSSSCANDYLRLRDASSWASLGKLCGELSSATTSRYVSVGNSMVITFHSNWHRVDQGFRLKYTAVSAQQGCGSNVNVGLQTSYISSPHYPLSYDNYEDCGWRLHTTLTGYVIDLNVITSVLESSYGCSYDFVKVYDGQDATAPSLGKWCGYEVPEKHSTGSYMYVKFRTDGSTVAAGFHIAVTAKKASSYASSSVNVGGIVGGIVGALVLLSLVACCVSTARKRPNATTTPRNGTSSNFSLRNTIGGAGIICRRQVTASTTNDIYSISPGNFPMSLQGQPAMFMPPPAYSEVIKDNPPPYSEAISSPTQIPVNQNGDNMATGGAAANAGVDNPAGPSPYEDNQET